MVSKEYIEELVLAECRKMLTPTNISRIASEIARLCENHLKPVEPFQIICHNTENDLWGPYNAFFGISQILCCLRIGTASRQGAICASLRIFRAFPRQRRGEKPQIRDSFEGG